MAICSLSEILHGGMSLGLHHGDAVDLDALAFRPSTDLPRPTIRALG